MATNPMAGDTKERVEQVAYEAVNYATYLWHLCKDKPVLVAIGGVVSSVGAKLTQALPDHLMSLGALVVLVVIDWITKYQACQNKGVPFTSKAMREKGLPKLRDYMLLYIAGAMTIPLLGDPWGFRSVLYFLALVELWSIAENLYDSGNLPFDIRQLAVFNGIRDLIAGKIMTTPHQAGGGVTAIPIEPPAAGPGSTDAPTDPTGGAQP